MRASRIWMQRSASLEISTVKRRNVKTPQAGHDRALTLVLPMVLPMINEGLI